MRDTRIKFSMTMVEVFTVLAEGNPGALNVLAQIYKEASRIDPDAAMGPLATLLNIDTFGIYGSRIWMLYKDVCGQDLTKTMAVLRATQLGITSEAALNKAIDNYGEGMDVTELLAAVKVELPNFGKAA